jgi:hypothetical protein
MHECIYCRRSLATQEFNREHVLSEAFGRFRETPVLHNTVCWSCNDSFGKELELHVARGAFEGLRRYELGVKEPAREILQPRYVEFTLPRESTWAGVRLNLAWGQGKLIVDLICQAAFLDRSTSRWVHFSESEIEAGAVAKQTTLDTKNVRIFGPSAADRARLLTLLARHGFRFGRLEDIDAPDGHFPNGDIEVEVTFTIDKVIRRCMAKYAFNFLAYAYGGTFVLERDFDTIRRFIRYGETPEYDLVLERFGPILQDDSVTRCQTFGHLLTVGWAESGVDLVGQVSLFNSVTYAVSLARQFAGIWRPIRSGLHFDLRDRRVLPIMGISRRLLP